MKYVIDNIEYDVVIEKKNNKLQAFNAKTVALDGDMEEGIDGLAAVMQKATSLSRKPVYPCEKSVIASALALSEELLRASCDRSRKTVTVSGLKQYADDKNDT